LKITGEIAGYLTVAFFLNGFFPVFPARNLQKYYS
jgi:hypothetical protein